MPDAFRPPATDRGVVDTTGGPKSTSWLLQRWNAATGAVGVVVGIVPHVLHHVGLLAGTALVAGSGGTALFGALGLVLSLPMLIRLHRKFDNWTAPAIGLAVFTALFALSTWVIGPAISGNAGTESPTPTINHNDHH
jgi:hypothetical protein